MHLHTHTADQIRAHLPPALAHRLEDAEAPEGIARRSFLKIATASGFALGAYPSSPAPSRVRPPPPPV